MAPRLLMVLLVLGAALAGCAGQDKAGNPPAESGGNPLLPWADQEFRTDGPFSHVSTPGPFDILTDERVALQSDLDGVDIQIGFVRPDTAEPVPVIAMSTWYLADVSRVAVRDACGDVREPRRGMCAMDAAFLVDNFVPHGYAVAIINARGLGGSGGCHTYAGPAEVADLSQAIAWLGSQPWSNGRVGMTGISYGGTTPWVVASTGNSYLKTIVPMEGAPSFHEQVIRNGTSVGAPPVAWFQQHNLGFSYGLLEPQDIEASPDRFCPEKAEFMAAMALLENDPYGDPLGFWEERDWSEAVLQNYRGSALVVVGFRDTFYPAAAEPWTATLRERGLVVHELWGRWHHAVPDFMGTHPLEVAAGDLNPTIRYDWAEMLLRWFDRELKGTDVDVGPPVQVADNTGAWRVEKEWPPRDATWTTLDLADFELVSQTPLATGSSVGPARGAVLRHHGFDHDIRVAGQPRLTVDVTPLGAKAVIAAWLRDAEQGKDEEFGYATMDLRYRSGKEAELVVPGQRLTLPLEFLPIDGYLPAGHPLELVFDMAYGVPSGGGSPPIVIHPEGQLHLPVVERNDDVFFEPPGAEG